MFSRSKYHCLLVASHSRVGFFCTIHIQQEFKVVLDLSQPARKLAGTEPSCSCKACILWPLSLTLAKKDSQECSMSSMNMPWPMKHIQEVRGQPVVVSSFCLARGSWSSNSALWASQQAQLPVEPSHPPWVSKGKWELTSERCLGEYVTFYKRIS